MGKEVVAAGRKALDWVVVRENSEGEYAGLGLAASANLNPERRFPSMFEPVHGSAPDIAGQGNTNPIGAIASAALMLDHSGLHTEARRLEAAIAATTASGHLTRDIGGTANTAETTEAIIAAFVGARAAV